jgi:hypothetical protein
VSHGIFSPARLKMIITPIAHVKMNVGKTLDGFSGSYVVKKTSNSKIAFPA